MFEGHPISGTLRRWNAELPGSRWHVVGGAVRDARLRRPLHDIDVLVTDADADSVARFLSERGSVDFVGRTFGVFKFASPDGLRLDVALPRRDLPAGTGGYRDVETVSDPHLPIADDLARRDFTVNAMAWDAEDGRLIDPHGGQADLALRLIRAVGNPHERFREDRTRMLRALRFAAQLGFGIEAETWGALRQAMPGVAEVRDGARVVPYELMAKELMKGLAADAVRTAELWTDSGSVQALMPELGDAWPTHVRAALARLEEDDVKRVLDGKPLPERVRIAAAFRHAGPDAEALAERLRLSSSGHGVDAGVVRRLASRRDVDLYKELGAEPWLDGTAVMRLLSLRAGPGVGEALDLLLDAQAKGMIAHPSEAEAWLIQRHRA